MTDTLVVEGREPRSSDAETASGSDGETAASEETQENSPEPTEEETTEAGSQTFGPGCSPIPAEGEGSFNGMATAPVASAARPTRC